MSPLPLTDAEKPRSFAGSIELKPCLTLCNKDQEACHILPVGGDHPTRKPLIESPSHDSAFCAKGQKPTQPAMETISSAASSQEESPTASIRGTSGVMDVLKDVRVFVRQGGDLSYKKVISVPNGAIKLQLGQRPISGGKHTVPALYVTYQDGKRQFKVLGRHSDHRDVPVTADFCEWGSLWCPGFVQGRVVMLAWDPRQRLQSSEPSHTSESGSIAEETHDESRDFQSSEGSV